MENIIVKEICPTTTQSWVNNGALLVDVREKEEVAELAYDVSELLNIPLTEFEDRYKEIPENRQVVLVCRSGGRSLRAAGYLVQHGYNPDLVVNMQHGIIRWAQKGFPLNGDISSVLATNTVSSCCDTIEVKKDAPSCNSNDGDARNKCC